MTKQLLNSVFAKYRDLSVSRRSITCLCLRHRQIIGLLATDKSRYFAQPRPIIAEHFEMVKKKQKKKNIDKHQGPVSRRSRKIFGPAKPQQKS